MNACAVIVLSVDGIIDSVKLFHGKDTTTIGKAAEAYFAEKVREIGIEDEDEIAMSIEDGYVYGEDGRAVFLTWPELQKV